MLTCYDLVQVYIASKPNSVRLQKQNLLAWAMLALRHRSYSVYGCTVSEGNGVKYVHALYSQQPAQVQRHFAAVTRR